MFRKQQKMVTPRTVCLHYEMQANGKPGAVFKLRYDP